ncbi:hypothetical protein ENBRE01_0313 [Enteropsectra breve]|nr:hypothetical protein ENBRE01_0313 [Enteropsectra breve]
MKTNFSLKCLLIFLPAMMRAANPSVSDLEPTLNNTCSGEETLPSSSADALLIDTVDEKKPKLSLTAQIKEFTRGNKSKFDEIAHLYNSISVGFADKYHRVIKNIRDMYPDECDELVKQIKTPIKENRAQFNSVCEKLGECISDPNAKGVLKAFDTIKNILNLCFPTLNFYNALLQHLDKPLPRGHVFLITKQPKKDLLDGISNSTFESFEEGAAALLHKDIKETLEKLTKEIGLILVKSPGVCVYSFIEKHKQFFNGEEEFYDVLSTNIPKLKMIADNLIMDAEIIVIKSSSDTKQE